MNLGEGSTFLPVAFRTKTPNNLKKKLYGIDFSSSTTVLTSTNCWDSTTSLHRTPNQNAPIAP